MDMVSEAADKIENLLQNPERLLEMGRQARMFAEREYAIAGVVQTHLDCYDDLIGRSART